MSIKRKINLQIIDDVTGKVAPPYLVLVNHGSMQDYRIDCTALYQTRPNHVGAYNQFIKREKLVKLLGGVPKRQFAADLSLVKQIKHTMDKCGVFVIYPEAAISIDGTNRFIHANIGKLVKLLNVPVVALNIKGSYISKPRWKKRHIKTDKAEAHLFPLFSANDTQSKTTEELHGGIVAALNHNVWQWQRENGVHINCDNFLEGTEYLMYQCPNCKQEFQTGTRGNTIFCNACGGNWTMNSLGQFSEENSADICDIKQWVDFQRSEARKQLQTDGFSFLVEVELQTLESLKVGYRRKGEGILTQTADGLTYKGKHRGQEINLNFTAKSTADGSLSLRHIEFSTLDTTYRFIMKGVNAAAKIYFLMVEAYLLCMK